MQKCETNINCYTFWYLTFGVKQVQTNNVVFSSMNESNHDELRFATTTMTTTITQNYDDAYDYTYNYE